MRAHPRPRQVPVPIGPRGLRLLGDRPAYDNNWKRARKEQCAEPCMHQTCGPSTALAADAGDLSAALQGQGRGRTTRW